MSMPEMNGLEAAAEMCKIDPNVPVLIMSGYHEIGVAQAPALHNVAGFLQKPFRISALQDKINKVLP